MAEDKISYERILEKCPDFGGVISKLSWDHLGNTNLKTVDWLKKLWLKNIEDNVKNKLWKKHGSISKDCVGLGLNKVLIGVGAGQSFNKNKDVLKRIADTDGIRSWKDRNFLIAASNHMYKPLLKMGIIPDFVSLIDGSDVVMDQLNKDIPSAGQNTILLAALHCSPNVLKEWSRQGREIRFYLTQTEGMAETFRKATHKHPMHHQVLQGGNVLNTLWSLGLKYLHSTTFMCLGNDLSYPLHDNIEKQRESYYADGDYSSNAPKTGTGRDEARAGKKWLGFSLNPSPIYTGNDKKRYNINLEIVGTSPTLWAYKVWIESTVLVNMKGERAYHYYNCSEGGIVGVMNKSMEFKDEDLRERSNWFMFDDVCPRWHTKTFKDATEEFLKAKEAYECPQKPIQIGVQGATDLAQVS